MTLLILICVAFIYFFGVDSSSAVKKKEVIIKSAKSEKPNNKFIQVTCRVTELLYVHDGDTFKVKVDNKIIMGFFPEGFSVRPVGINTAEVGGKKETGFFAKRRQQTEFKKGFKQKAIAEKLLANSIIELQTICQDPNPGRIVCKVTVIKNGKRIDYADYMIKHAGAKEYSGKGEKRY